MDRDEIFHREVIAEYIAHGCPELTRASAGNRRSQLLRMSELLLGPADRVVRLAPLPPSDPSAPYTRAEVIALRSWANSQGTAYRVANCNVFLGLGLGTGLSAAEIGEVRVRDILIDTDGVQVKVSGNRARLVPVLAEWEAELVHIAGQAPHENMLMFRPLRKGTYANLITNFVDATSPGRVRASARRMRATWLVTHLASGTPPRALLAAAGVDSLEALTRYLRFVPEGDPEQMRRALREAYRRADDLP